MTKNEIPDELRRLINDAVERRMEYEEHPWLDADCPKVKSFCGECGECGERAEECRLRLNPGECARRDVSSVCGACQNCFEQSWRAEFGAILDGISVASRQELLRKLEDHNGLRRDAFKGVERSCVDADSLLEWLALGWFIDGLSVCHLGDGQFAIDCNAAI